MTYYQSGRPLPVWRADDFAGVGDTTAQPWNLVGDPKISNQQFSQGRGNDQNFWFDPPPSPAPHRAPSATPAEPGVTGPGGRSWDIALFKNLPLRGSMRLQLPLEAFNFLNHPNVGNPFDTAGSTGTAVGTLAGVIVDPATPTSGACSPRRASATSSWG